MRISAYRYKNHQLHNNFTLSVGAPDTTYTGSCNLKTAYPGCLRPGYSVTRVLRSRYHVSGVLRPGHAVSAGSLVPSEWPTIRRRIYIHVLDKQLHTMVNTYILFLANSCYVYVYRANKDDHSEQYCIWRRGYLCTVLPSYTLTW